eukprot:542567_1
MHQVMNDVITKRTSCNRQHTRMNLYGVENFTIGGLAGVLSVSVTNPLHRVSVVATSNAGNIKPIVLRNTLKSFWIGNMSKCIRYFPQQGFLFMFKEKIHQYLDSDASQSIANTFSKNTVSGSISGLISLQFFNAMDYVSRKNINLSSRDGGLIGLYNRYLMSCATVMIYRGLYFGLYDTLHPLLLGDEKTHFAQSFVLSYCTTSIAAAVIYPLHYIERVQNRMIREHVRHSGIVSTMTWIIRKEGVRALYRGSNLLGIYSVCGATTLVAFDVIKALYMGQLQFAL